MPSALFPAIPFPLHAYPVFMGLGICISTSLPIISMSLLREELSMYTNTLALTCMKTIKLWSEPKDVWGSHHYLTPLSPVLPFFLLILLPCSLSCRRWYQRHAHGWASSPHGLPCFDQLVVSLHSHHWPWHKLSLSKTDEDTVLHYSKGINTAHIKGDWIEAAMIYFEPWK